MAAQSPASRLSELVDTSQHGEAAAVAGIVADDWTPYVIDVGANDGRALSNSFPFLALGWSGLLIEPAPAPFEQLARLYRDRDDIVCVQAACGEADGTGFLALGQDPLVMTSAFEANASSARAIAVPVRSLTSLLAEHGAPPEPAILSVDAEGMDYEVLAGLDFDRFRPRVVVTEDDLRQPDKHAAKVRLLEERGYAFYAPVGNAIWVTRDALDGEYGTPVVDREGALQRAGSAILARRCIELERSREEIWSQLAAVRESKSWRLTRPLRDLVERLRSRAGGS